MDVFSPRFFGHFWRGKLSQKCGENTPKIPIMKMAQTGSWCFRGGVAHAPFASGVVRHSEIPCATHPAIEDPGGQHRHRDGLGQISESDSPRTECRGGGWRRCRWRRRGWGGWVSRTVARRRVPQRRKQPVALVVPSTGPPDTSWVWKACEGWTIPAPRRVAGIDSAQTQTVLRCRFGYFSFDQGVGERERGGCLLQAGSRIQLESENGQ